MTATAGLLQVITMRSSMKLLAAAVMLALCGGTAAAVYQPTTNVTAHVWTNANSESFVYPEQSDTEWGIPSLISKPNFGVAVSGGGFRAATNALGWVRALSDMGYLRSARYLSSNSGGSWFNGAFSFTQVPTSTFLGPYVPPANLDNAAFNSSLTPDSFGQVITNATIIEQAISGVISDALTPNTQARVSGWASAVGQAFLNPYDVGVESATITALGTRGRVHERVAAGYPALTVLTATTDKPFPLMLGSLLLPQQTQQFYPTDFTPLYIGVPAQYNTTNPLLGPGFVEPLGFNSYPPAHPPAASPNGSQTVSVQPFFTVPLVTIVGISSSFVALGTHSPNSEVQELTGTQNLYYWNQQNFNGQQVAFADGGGVDNSGIIPLLRRRVSTIVAGLSTVTSPLNTTSAQWAVSQYDIAALWGATPTNASSLTNVNGVGPVLWNKLVQVFPTSEFQSFFNTMQQRVAAGQTPYVRAQYQVLDNPLQGVRGGFTVDILFVLNMPNAAWQNALPAATQQMLANSQSGSGSGIISSISSDITDVTNGGSGGNLQNFPYLSTYNVNYNAATTTLLNQLSDYNMRQLNATISSMLQAAASNASTAASG